MGMYVNPGNSGFAAKMLCAYYDKTCDSAALFADLQIAVEVLWEELPAGAGYADMIYLPKRGSRLPALVIELKWNGA